MKCAQVIIEVILSEYRVYQRPLFKVLGGVMRFCGLKLYSESKFLITMEYNNKKNDMDYV